MTSSLGEPNVIAIVFFLLFIVMSLGITLINVYYSMRGSEIAVDPPAQLILYRDGVKRMRPDGLC